MSRAEAIEQYNTALKLGKKYYSACMAQGQYPYPQVLDQMLENTPTAGTVNLGLVDIPTDRIVGTYAEGRKSAFAGNFMPLLDPSSEFADKWINLCEAHLGEIGIRDPITCYEYLGKFYVQEGNKRVSVLKSYEAVTIPGNVMRIIPAPSEEPEIQRYGEFMKFYKVSRLYIVDFTQLGGYAKLLAALGMDPAQEWEEETRRAFSTDYRRFAASFDKLNTEKLPLAPGDALLSFLKVHPYAEMQKMTSTEIHTALEALWPDIRLLAQGEPISVATQPEKKEMGLLTRILAPKLHVAFIYNFDPQVSPWAAGHQQGQQYLEEKLGGTVQISAHLCGDSADETMETAIAQGANVLFATTPTLIDACRRVAAKHKNVAVYNCSLSMPYAGVRSYYCRVFEGKFIAGAVCGAMAGNDRIGYVANYPIMGVPSAVNAFALGARMTNPRARIHLEWSCLPGNPSQKFAEQGITLISNRDDQGTKPYGGWHVGTYQMLPGNVMQPLVTLRWNWGVFYEKTVRSLLSGGIDAARDDSHAINDWWGLSTGVVDLDMDPGMPEGIRQLAGILKDGIIREQIDPFLTAIRDQAGTERSDGSRKFTLEELMRMDWLCENVDGAIPGFEELLPQSQDLVRLLGIYRETIPPKTEEAAL